MNIKKMIRKYNTQLYNDKFYNLEEKNKFFERHKLLKLLKEGIDN